MSDDENQDAKDEFIKRYNEFMEEAAEQASKEEEEIVQDVSETIASIIHEGAVYVHGGHIEEVVNELVIRLNSAVDPYEDDDEVPPQVQGYVMGLGETARILNIIVRGLVRKHAGEMELPVDKLMEDINDILRDSDEG